MLVFQLIDRTLLRLPPPLVRLDFSHVKSIQDLSVDPIEDWCLLAEHDSCQCSNPLIPEGRQEDPRWEKTHHTNKNTIRSRDLDDIDIVFLGDSITEGWQGHFYSRPDDRVHGAEEVFRTYFRKKYKAKYEGISQGISADTIPNLLWRIQNGEIRTYSEFHSDTKNKRQSATPLVFWVLIGTNDLGNTNCSPDMVVLGIIRIVEELILREPTALIVVNGILPRTFDQSSGYVMQSKDQKQPIFWPSIKIINAHLQRYADKRGDNIHYYDAAHVFLTNHTAIDAALRINKSLMTDCLHPSAEGYRLWGAEIVALLDSLFTSTTTND